MCIRPLYYTLQIQWALFLKFTTQLFHNAHYWKTSANSKSCWGLSLFDLAYRLLIHQAKKLVRVDPNRDHQFSIFEFLKWFSKQAFSSKEEDLLQHAQGILTDLCSKTLIKLLQFSSFQKARYWCNHIWPFYATLLADSYISLFLCKKFHFPENKLLYLPFLRSFLQVLRSKIVGIQVFILSFSKELKI